MCFSLVQQINQVGAIAIIIKINMMTHSNKSTESNKPRTMQEGFEASCNSYAFPCNWPDASSV